MESDTESEVSLSIETCVSCYRAEETPDNRFIHPCSSCSAAYHQRCFVMECKAGLIQEQFIRKRGLSTNFIRPKSLRLTFLGNILLSNLRYVNTITLSCSNCYNIILVYGKPPTLLEKMQDIKNCFFKWCSRAATYIVLGIKLLTMNTILSGGLVGQLFWDFGPRGKLLLLDASLFPHMVYSLTSPNVGIANVLLASGYTLFDFGTGRSRLRSTVRKLLQVKLCAGLFYNAIINRYFLGSFRATIPAIYGARIECVDAWSIQHYRNSYEEDEVYESFTFTEKVMRFFYDTWWSFKEDFGKLYKIQPTDFIMSHIGGLVCYGSGLLLRTVATPYFSNIYYTDGENLAYTTLVGIAGAQAMYYLVSNFDAIMISVSYKCLKPKDPSQLGFSFKDLMSYCIALFLNANK